MVNCPRCGAAIDPSALACPYCQTQTPYGRQQQERHAAHQYHAAQAQQVQQAAERQNRQQALTKKGQSALFWSIAATLTCCLPAAIVGLVMGLNVKSAAKKEGAIAPATSTVAVVLGCSSIALFFVVIALYLNDSRTRDARISALRTQVDTARSRDTIDQPLACALVELGLLEDGYLDKSGIMIEAFQCDGKLEQNKDTATLNDVRFRTSSSERHLVTACLTRAARWSVKELRADSSCAPRAVAPSASAGAP
jgi:F0F1-type ATP synthase membrane subunit c/vacuolar-type H+-ATPase subunit K